MNPLLKYLFFAFLMVVNSGSYAQVNQVIFDHISSEEGLSEVVVNSIYQDSKGFMWFGTNDGLNRYDGYNIKIYKPSPGQEGKISSNLIFALTEDHEKNLWVGTTGGGLNCFDPIKETFITYRKEFDNPNSLPSDHILNLHTDSKGRIWVGTLEGLALVQRNPSTGDTLQIKRVMYPQDKHLFSVFSIEEDKSGDLWVGTRYGLYHIKVKDQVADFEISKIAIDPKLKKKLIQVRSLQLDKYGNLIVGSQFGLYHQTKHGTDLKFIKIDKSQQQDLEIDNLGRIWGGSNLGLSCFEVGKRNTPLVFKGSYQTEPTNPKSLNKNLIRSLFRDRTGVIWIGTNGGGVNKFNPERKAFAHYFQELTRDGNRYKEVRSVFEDQKGNLWVGTEGGGLYKQELQEDPATYNNFMPIASNSNQVFTLAEVQEGADTYVYLGSEDPPFLQKININDSANQITSAQEKGISSVFSILQGSDKTLWIGCYNGGLHRWIPDGEGDYKRSNFRFDNNRPNSLSNNIVRKVLEDKDGNLWIGTGNGLNMLAADQKLGEELEFSVYQFKPHDPTSISHNYILDIFESKSGDLWIATFSGGLNKLNLVDGKATFERFSMDDGLPNNTIKSIEEDLEGNLWIATNHGLSKFDPKEKVFQNFTTNDGLQSSQFFEGASIQRSTGELIFGGVNGFNVFYPENIIIDQKPPSVLFTKLLIHNKEIQAGEELDGKVILPQAISDASEIELKYSQNDFSIEFAGIHYSAPDENRYVYQLEGYHQDWIEVDANKRYATFTNLPHGSYILKVRASNGDDIWLEQPVTLNITIRPPFWLTWYAYIFYAFLLVGSLYLFQRYTLISIQEKHKLTLDHMEREKLEELNQMKLRFFTNISHELRTPLTLIIAPLENILEKGKSLTPEALQQQYHYMYKNAKYLLRLVNQLLDFRKLDQGSLNLHVDRGNMVDFIQETTEPFQFLANKKNINFKIFQSEGDIYTYFDPEVIEKIMNNLLSNAFKFTPFGGEITVKVAEKHDPLRTKLGRYVEIRVQDDGPGISRKKLEKVFERFYKEGAKKENKDGAGIGLSYVKSLAELHRGTIDIESIKGKGACFIVRLPQDKDAYLTSEIENSRIQQFEPSTDPLDYLVADPIQGISQSSIHVDYEELAEDLPLMLFVDDNADIRRFIREGFENDFRIIEAEDGDKGYQMALSSLPDIIVSDVMMPNMNGIELCEALKTNALTSHIPIVLLTAKSASEDKLEGIQTGADAYVVKPFKLDILRAQLLNITIQRQRLKQRFKQEVLLEPEEITVTSVDEIFLKKAMTIIEENMSDSEFNVEALAKEMYLSRSKLYLKLKALTGQSSSEFMRTIRLKRAIQLLEKSDYTIKEIMYMTGFNTASYFSKCFKKQFGVVPSEYLRKQKGIENKEEGILSETNEVEG